MEQQTNSDMWHGDPCPVCLQTEHMVRPGKPFGHTVCAACVPSAREDVEEQAAGFEDSLEELENEVGWAAEKLTRFATLVRHGLRLDVATRARLATLFNDVSGVFEVEEALFELLEAIEEQDDED